MRLRGKTPPGKEKTHSLISEALPWDPGRPATSLPAVPREPLGDPMGPSPHDAILALSDLGLTETEIASYFGVELNRIRHIRSGNSVGGLIDTGTHGKAGDIPRAVVSYQ